MGLQPNCPSPSNPLRIKKCPETNSARAGWGGGEGSPTLLQRFLGIVSTDHKIIGHTKRTGMAGEKIAQKQNPIQPAENECRDVKFYTVSSPSPILSSRFPARAPDRSPPSPRLRPPWIGMRYDVREQGNKSQSLRRRVGDVTISPPIPRSPSFSHLVSHHRRFPADDKPLPRTAAPSFPTRTK